MPLFPPALFHKQQNPALLFPPQRPEPILSLSSSISLVTLRRERLPDLPIPARLELHSKNVDDPQQRHPRQIQNHLTRIARLPSRRGGRPRSCAHLIFSSSCSVHCTSPRSFVSARTFAITGGSIGLASCPHSRRTYVSTAEICSSSSALSPGISRSIVFFPTLIGPCNPCSAMRATRAGEPSAHSLSTSGGATPSRPNPDA